MTFSIKLGTGSYTDDITDSVLHDSVKISDSMQVGADTMTFNSYIRNQQYSIKVGTEVQVYDTVTNTTVYADASTTIITVASTKGMFIGDIIVLGDIEHVKILNISGLILTVQRGMGSTLAIAHSNNSSVSLILFGGNITSMTTSKESNSNITIHEVQAKDYVWMLDRRFLNKLYGEKASATGVKRTDAGADADDEGMIEEILYDLRNDANNDKGIYSIDAYYDAFYGNISSVNIDTAPIVKQQIFKRTPASQAISAIAGLAGFHWWLDASKQIHYKSIADTPARHLPVIEGEHTLDIDNNIDDYRDFSYSIDVEDVGTKAVLQEPLVKSSSSDTFTTEALSATEASRTYIWKLPFRPFSNLDVTLLKITRSNNAEVYIVGDGNANLQLENVHREANDHSTTASGGSFYAFLQMGPVNTNSSHIRFEPDALQTGDVITITYNYIVKTDYFSRSTDSVEDMRVRTGGDGVHEFIYEDSREIVANGAKDIDAIASAVLFRNSLPFITGTFQSFTKGWRAGQVFRIRWISENIDLTVWVLNVDRTIISPEDLRDGDNSINHNISFSNMPRGFR